MYGIAETCFACEISSVDSNFDIASRPGGERLSWGVDDG